MIEFYFRRLINLRKLEFNISIAQLNPLSIMLR